MKKILLLISVVILVSILLFSAFENRLFAHGKEKRVSKTSNNTITYTETIKPLFKKRCAKCYGGNPLNI